MAGNLRNDLVSALRGKLSDDRATVAAFALAVTANAKSALLEITNNHFIITVEQGENVSSIRFNLADPRYATVGKLFDQLSKQRGYQVVADQHMHSDHPSGDLRVDGMQQIAPKGSYTPKHYLWSDTELSEFVVEAAALHNPNYTTVSQVPKNEHPFVLMKAAANAYRSLAADAARRKGLETDASVLLRLASDLEAQYRADLERLRRVVPVPKADESKMGFGDVVNGTLVHRSLRSGYTSPARPAGASQPPRLYDPADDDVEDTIIRLRWAQAREQRFSYFELWRDTQPKVDRCLNGRLEVQGDAAASLAASSQYSKAGTSKQVFGMFSNGNSISPVFDGFFFWTAAEQAGASPSMATFIDGASSAGDPIEPDTDYYYRLYAVDWNGEILPSEVKKVHTKNTRASFKRDANGALAADAISPVLGGIAGGTVITILGTGFVAGTQVFIGSKEAVVTVTNATTLSVVSPAMTNAQFVGRQVDIVIVHPNGLRDIVVRGWKFT